MKKKIILSGVCLALGSGAAWAQRVHPDAGTSSAAFLKIGVGARPIGMGEAFTAVADDVNAVYWNPAGLAGQTNASVGGMHDESFQGLRHEFLGYVEPRPGRTDGSVWGLNAISLIVPNDLERRSGLMESDPFNPISSSEGNFGAYDLAFGASYARNFGESAALGGTLKYIRQSIDNQSAETFAADLGWKKRHALGPVDLGAAVQNFGPGVRFATQYPLPLTFKLGAAYSPIRSLLTAFDVSIPRDDYPTLAFGSEFHINEILFLRAGYGYRWYGDPLGAFSGFRGGIGLQFQRLSLDYAFSPFGDLGNAHRISVGWKFGAGASPIHTNAASVAPVETAATLAAQGQFAAGAVDTSDGGFTNFAVTAMPRVVSAHGTEYNVEAQAPSPDWLLRSLEFRSRTPSLDGLAVQVRREALPAALPDGFKPTQTYRLRFNRAIDARNVTLQVAEPSAGDADSVPVSVFSWAGGRWEALKLEKLRALCRALPEVIAIAVPSQP